MSKLLRSNLLLEVEALIETNVAVVSKTTTREKDPHSLFLGASRTTPSSSSNCLARKIPSYTRFAQPCLYGRGSVSHVGDSRYRKGEDGVGSCCYDSRRLGRFRQQNVLMNHLQIMQYMTSFGKSHNQLVNQWHLLFHVG